MTALPPEPEGKRATRLSDGLTLEEEWLELGARSWSCRAWLIHDGQAVAYASYLLNHKDRAPLLLNDIEVRKSRRGQGWAHRIIHEVEALHGQTMQRLGALHGAGRRRVGYLAPLHRRTQGRDERAKEAGEPARDYCPSCALTILNPDYEQEPLPFG